MQLKLDRINKLSRIKAAFASPSVTPSRIPTVGERLKKAGMKQAAANRPDALAHARMIARQIALSRADRTCSADLVQAVLADHGVELGNAAGPLFQTGEWEFVEWRPSEWPSARRRHIRVWRLKDSTTEGESA